MNKFNPLGLSDDEPEYKKHNHLDIEKSSDSVYFVEKSGRRTLLGRFFRGMSEYNSADAYFDDWSHRPALVRDMDSRAGSLDTDAIRKKCLDEATGKVDEDKYRQEIINGLKGNWREQRQNFEEHQNSLGNRLTVEQLRSEVWRQRQDEDADAYTPIYGRVIFGEDRFGTGLSNASNRNRIVESQVKQIEIGLKVAEYAVDLGMMVPWGGLGSGGKAVAHGLSIPLEAASGKQVAEVLPKYLEYRALRMQKPGSKAKDIYAIMKGFDQGDAQGCLFHFTTLKSGRAIVDSGYIRQTSGPFSFLFGGTGVYAGTTPTPSFLLKHASPFGWGLGHTPVRIPIVYKELGVETRLPRGILPPLKTRIITATDGKLNLIR